MSKKNEFREDIANRFLKILEEEPKEWHKAWNFDNAPINLISKRRYKGVNFLNLSMAQRVLVSGDPRWATFKQIQDKGLRLKQGSKGHKVEYHMPYDTEKKKAIKWEDYNKYVNEGRDRNEFTIVSKYFTVFNGADIEGLEPYNAKYNVDVKADELTTRIREALDVKVTNIEQGRAYYSPSSDSIIIPLEKQFESSYEYNATLLHELVHSTGAEHRLNRDLSNKFGTEGYAYEELIAEITTCYMGEYMENIMSDKNFENHSAYISSWIRNIKDDKNFLFKALKQAEETATYIEDIAQLHEYKKENVVQLEKEKKEVKEKPIISFSKGNEEIEF